MADSQDFIPDDQFKPDDETQAAPTAPPAAAPVQAPTPDANGFIPDDQFKSDEDLAASKEAPAAPDNPLEQAGTYAEQVAQGFAGPIATGVERLAGVNPADIEARAAKYPIGSDIAKYGTFAASMLTGTGEMGLIAKAGEAVANAAKLGKVGSTALRAAIEGGLLGAGDKTNDYMLGKEDPTDDAAATAAKIGFGGLTGAATGGVLGMGGALAAKGASGALKTIADTKLGGSMGKFLTDFGSRWKWNQENPDLLNAVTDELQNYHNSNSAIRDQVYGMSGLKAKAIDQLTQDVTPEQISSHIGQVEDTLAGAHKDAAQYSPFQDAVASWKGSVMPKLDAATGQVISQPSPSEVFAATDLLKRQMQEWGQYNKQMTPLTEQPFRNSAKSISTILKGTLEDSGTWNKAGGFQKGLNDAVSKFIGPEKDFLSKFTEKVEGDPEISPGKVNTYLNQQGKAGGKVRQKMLGNYVDAAENYRNTVADLHSSLGLDSPIPHAPLDAVRGTLDQAPSSGAQMADKLFHGGVNNFANKSVSTAVGGAEGYKRGGIKGAIIGSLAGMAAPHLEEAAGRTIRDYAVPTVLRLLSSGATDAIGPALQHADNVHYGNKMIVNGVNSLFEGGKQSGIIDSDKVRDKIKDYVSQGGMHADVQNQFGTPSAPEPSPSPSPVPHMAEGGEVLDQPAMPEEVAPSQKKGVDAAFPGQSLMLNTAHARVSNYLNGIRPQPPVGAGPFDTALPDPQKDRHYDNAVKIAASPLSIIDKMHDGTLKSEDMKHFGTMWPEVHNALAKKITERITGDQKKGIKPEYSQRHMMSLFMGQPLERGFQPQNIIAAQSAFQPAQGGSSNPPVTKNKKNTSKLGELPKNYETAGQAGEARRGGKA